MTARTSEDAKDDDSKAENRKVGKWIGIGAAGIGSAAIVAALLYSRRARKAPPLRGPIEADD